MSLTIDRVQSRNTLETTLNYAKRVEKRLYSYAYEPPDDRPQTNILEETHDVLIHDIRSAAERVSLDREGFAVASHKSAVRDFWNEEDIRSIYYPEAEEFLKRVTGANRVFIFDHVLRKHEPGIEDRRGGLRQPATRVHVDHTALSGPQRIRHFLSEDGEQLLKGRAQIVNVWRPLIGPLRDAPLALCDAGSVATKDLIPSDLIYADRTGETYNVGYNPAHRWFYLSNMNPDEVLLIKCFDTKEDGRARFAPHTSFTDPTAPSDAPRRQSIELRSFVFHDA